MSAYNTVVLPDEEKCPHCGAVIRRRVQFKYGDTWQHDYMIGDRIKRSEMTSGAGPAGDGTRLSRGLPGVRK